MNSILLYILYPFAVLYKLITSFRNHLYNIGHFHSFNFQIKTISVGNLTVGGTGKTPHIEYLIELLKSKNQICTLSRGYGRKTRGIVFADKTSNPALIGDEPMQYFRKFYPKVNVVVGEERALAIPTIMHELPETNLILLDDAYQHRPVIPGLNILLSDYNKPFYEDHLMPAGRLRESRHGARRADIIIVSKCPNFISLQEMDAVRQKIVPFKKDSTSVFFTGIKYGGLQPLFSISNIFGKAIAVSGIANSTFFVDHISSQFKILDKLHFNDHHDYSQKDIQKLRAVYDSYHNENPVIVTTEKDMVKLIAFKDDLGMLPIFYIPIQVYFINETEKKSFEDLIASYLALEISH